MSAEGAQGPAGPPELSEASDPQPQSPSLSMRALVPSIFCKERHTNHLRLGAETGQGALGVNFPGWSDRDTRVFCDVTRRPGRAWVTEEGSKGGWTVRVVCVAGGGGL